MEKKECYQKYAEIMERAESMGYLEKKDRVTIIMDIESADMKFHLRLDEWLHADDMNFAHDFLGIRHSIVRNGFPATDFGTFVPRFAG